MKIEARNPTYGFKDEYKASLANKFIGLGSPGSSTDSYRRQCGEMANCGSYQKGDVVFISANGSRPGQVKPPRAEIELASRADVMFITDVPSDRSRAYNSGEREVASILSRLGYGEFAPGRWMRRHHPETEIAAPEKA